MAPRGSSAVNGRVAYQQLETLVRQDAVMKRARLDKARAEAKGPIEYLWPLLGALCLVLLVAVSIHGFTDHTEMGHGVGSASRGDDAGGEARRAGRRGEEQHPERSEEHALRRKKVRRLRVSRRVLERRASGYLQPGENREGRLQRDLERRRRG